MRTIREIIEDLGGSTKVAAEHDPPIPQSTVDSWMRSNSVPRWRVPDLKKTAEKLGKPLTDNDFPPKAARLKLVS